MRTAPGGKNGGTPVAQGRRQKEDVRKGRIKTEKKSRMDKGSTPPKLLRRPELRIRCEQAGILYQVNRRQRKQVHREKGMREKGVWLGIS